MNFLLIASLLLASGAEAAPAERARVLGDPDVQAVSLLGRELRAPALDDAFRAEQERLLAEARAALRAAPGDAGARIWVGRRTAYLGRYREAIEIYSRGIDAHPAEPRLYRHRGHRFITLRRLDDAIADLERAAALIEGRPDEVEPDGLPNARNTPTSTLHSNVWYHLGLARYLNGDFDGALRAYRQCRKVAGNPDMLVATSHWLYMTLRRLGKLGEALQVLEPIDAEMDIIENHDYHRLLMMYKGALEAEALLEQSRADGGGLGFATIAYGVGNWHLYGGDRPRALDVFRQVVEGETWAAFGFLAAEAELARLEPAD